MNSKTETHFFDRGSGSMATSTPDLSIVIPVLDEEDNLQALYQEIVDVIQLTGKRFEILFVDDGSADASFTLLKSIHSRDDRVRVVRFRRNFGQTAALAAGFKLAKAPVIVTLDADRQNDPRDIPLLLDRLEAGFDMVCGWRKERQDPFISRRVPSAIANRIISFTTGVHLHDYGCTLKAFRADVVKSIDLYGEMHRFIPAVASGIGVSIDEVVVTHRPRKKGSSKYGISRTFRVILDLMTVKFLLSYSSRPLQVFGSLGMLMGGVGFVMGLYLTWVKFGLNVPIGGRPLLVLASLLMLGGLQLMSLGLLGELLVRIFHENRTRPTYAVREMLSRND